MWATGTRLLEVGDVEVVLARTMAHAALAVEGNK